MNLFISLGLRGAEAAKQGLQRFTEAGTRQARMLTTAWKASGRVMSDTASLMYKTAMFVGGTALLREAILDVTAFEKALTEVRLTGGLTAQEIAKVRKSFLDWSVPDLQLPEDQLAAYKDMVSAGVDPQQIIGSMRAINRTATAEFAQVTDIASTSIDLLQKMRIAPEGMERAFNIIAKAGKEGRFELKDMAQYFPAVTSDAQKFGMTGERGLAQLAAMLQIARKGTAIPAEATTNMRNFFAHIIQYREELLKLKINIFDFIDVKTGRFKAGKDFDTFFEDIIKKTKGSPAMLSLVGIRDQQAMDFIVQMMQNWKEYQRIRDEAMKGAGENVVGKDFDTAQNEPWARYKKLEIDESKAKKAGGSSWLASTVSKGLNAAVEHPIAAILAAGGAYSAYRLGKGYLKGRLGGGGDGIAGGLAGSAGVQKVFVVNFPGASDMLSNPLYGGPPVGKNLPPTFGKTLKDLVTARGTGGLLGSGKGLGALRTGATVASAGLGTSALFVAGAGAAGWGIGRTISHIPTGGGRDVQTRLEDLFAKILMSKKDYEDYIRPEPPEVKNDIKLTVNVAADARPQVIQEGRNKTNLSVNRGVF